MRKIIVVDQLKDWPVHLVGVETVPAKIYLTDAAFVQSENTRVFNLCRSYRYQSTGYYVSLLSEARGHRAIPSVSTIQDFRSQTILRAISEELDELIQKNLAHLKSPTFVLSIYFGRNVSRLYEKLSKELYELFQAPFLRAHFSYSRKWTLQSIAPIPLNEIPEAHRPYLADFAKEYFLRRHPRSIRIKRFHYQLGILVDPADRSPPSNKTALRKFAEAAEDVGIGTDFLLQEDYGRLGEFDALFIRATTSVNHYTYRFSRRAAAEGMVVIDDPWSILRCTNKVYISELMSKEGVPIPKTMIVHQDNRHQVARELGLPCVIKQPDSAFSFGVKKASSAEELEERLEELFKGSDFLIAQEYVPTAFDWRIGVLDKKPIFACKYFMARNHWQIYNWDGDGSRPTDRAGPSETLPIELVPARVLKTALKAANLIGDGFYGVDLKQCGDRVLIIEVNDNPSVENGVEDALVKDQLYATVMASFLQRLERMKTRAEIVL